MSVIRDHKPKKEDFQKIFRFIVVYVTLTVIGLSEFLLVKSKEVFADELHQSLSDDITRGGGLLDPRTITSSQEILPCD